MAILKTMALSDDTITNLLYSPEGTSQVLTKFGVLSVENRSCEICGYVPAMGNSVKELSSKDELIYELSSSDAKTKYKIGDILNVKNHATYIIDDLTLAISNAISGQVSGMTRLTQTKLFSEYEDTSLSVNGMTGRAVVDSQPAKYWYKNDTGITFHKKSQLESDCVRKVLLSNSEKCYYIATTEGLYRSWNEDMGECERIMGAELRIPGGELSVASHVMEITEIGNKTYFLTVTGYTNSTARGFLYSPKYDPLLSSVNLPGGWPYNAVILSKNGDEITLFCTNANQEKFGTIIRVKVPTDSKPYVLDTVQKVKGGTSGEHNSSQYAQVFGEKLFTSRHYSESSGGTKAYGVDWCEIADITGSETIPVNVIPELSTARIYQLRQTGGRLFACAGGSMASDPLGLFEIMTTGSVPTCVSLKNDPVLSGFAKAKDILFSEKPGKWVFIFGNKIYTANGTADQWDEPEYTGFEIGNEYGGKESNPFPLMFECGKFIATNKIEYSSNGTELNASSIMTNVLANRTVATIDDVTVRNVKVDGDFVDPDEHGFLDISVKDRLRSCMVVCDSLPQTMEDGVLYLIRKGS